MNKLEHAMYFLLFALVATMMFLLWQERDQIRDGIIPDETQQEEEEEEQPIIDEEIDYEYLEDLVINIDTLIYLIEQFEEETREIKLDDEEWVDNLIILMKDIQFYSRQSTNLQPPKELQILHDFYLLGMHSYYLAMEYFASAIVGNVVNDINYGYTFLVKGNTYIEKATQAVDQLIGE